MGLSVWKSLAKGGSKNVSSVQPRQTSQRSSGKTNPRAKMAKSRASAKKTDASERGPSPALTRKFEERWRAESDMRTLAETAKILEEPSRVRAAKKVAMEQATAAQEAAAAVMNVKVERGNYGGSEE